MLSLCFSATRAWALTPLFLQLDAGLCKVVLRLFIDEASFLVCLNDSRRSLGSYPHFADALEQSQGGPARHNIDRCK